MPQLKLISGPDAGRALPLAAGGTVRIGRKPPPAAGAGPFTDLVLDDKKLSRLHCEILSVENSWVLRDRGSSNGTFLNGERVEESALRPGDMIQVGDLFLEFHGAGGGAPASEKDTAPEARTGAETGARTETPRRPPFARRRARPGRSLSPAPLLLFFALAGGVAAVVILRSRDEQAGRGAADRPAGAAAGKGTAGAESEPLADLAAPVLDPLHAAPAEAVAARLLAGEYPEAIAYLDGLPRGDVDLRALRKKVIDAALEELRVAAGEAEAKILSGDRTGGRERMMAFLQRAPFEIEVQAAAALERIDGLERGQLHVETRGKDAARPRPAGTAAAPPRADPDAIEVRVKALSAKWKEISGGAPDRRRLEEFCREVGEFARAGRARPDYAASRAAIAALFVKAKAECLKLAGRPLFAAPKAEWKGNRISLRYDFTNEVQLRDFEKLAESAVIRRAGNALFVKGECRLLRGDPFAGMIAVRAQTPDGGYDRAAPNITVALFTGAKDRLRAEGQAPRSLFIFLGGTSGPDPNDFVAFAIGYRAAVADYGGKPIESVYVAGQTEPLPMPAHAVFFGTHGAPLHSDSRECTWALPVKETSGALDVEVRAEGDDLAWKLNGKPLPAQGAAAYARWAGGPARRGSVSILTGPEGARFTSLEVEGEVRSGWVEDLFRAEALAAFREFDPGK